MTRWLALTACCASLLPGCLVNFDETTLVRVRHPSSVSVRAPTPSGAESLLPADGPPQQAEISGTTPPFTEEVKYAVAVRHDSGEVTLTCPHCEGATEATVVPNDAPIALHGSPDKTLSWTPNALGMRFGQDALFRCYRHPRSKCPREALSLWLETPLTNVVDVRYRKRVGTAHGERVGAWAGAIVGSLLFASGIALGVGYSIDEGGPSQGPLLLGGVAVGVGALFATAGILGILAKDSETTLYRIRAPAPPSPP